MTELVAFTIYWITFGILAYVNVGYCLLLLMAALLTRSPRRASIVPEVTLIVPAHNEEKVLKQKLENTAALEYPKDKLEVIVASDGSRDGTNQIAAEFAAQGVRLLAFEQRRGKASVVNDAVQAASGDVLCMCDANVMFRPDALSRLVETLADPSIGAVSGDVILASEESNFGEGEGLYYKIEKRLQRAESDVGSLMGVDGGMYVIRKELFRPLPADTILDDFVISMHALKQGKRVVFDPTAIARENGTPKAAQEFRRRVRVSAGSVQSIKRGDWPPLSRPVWFWQYLSHKPLRWLGPIWLMLILISNVALWPTHWFYQATLVCQLLCYALAGVGLASVRLRQTRLIGIPFYFALSHVAMAVGMFKGLFNRQKVTWQQADRATAGETAEKPSMG